MHGVIHTSIVCVYEFRRGFCTSVLSFLSVVEPPVMYIYQDRYPLYAGTAVTFTCVATLNSSVRYDQQNIEISWSGLEEMYPRYTISEVVEVSDGSYASNLTISPLSYYDDRYEIECNGTVTGYNIEPASSNTAVDLDIRKKGVFNFNLAFVSI